MDTNALQDAMLGLLAVLVVSSLAGWVLALAGMRGARLLGGIAAGVLLGPSIAGAVWPAGYQRLILGGQPQSIALVQQQRSVDARRFASAGLQLGSQGDVVQGAEGAEIAADAESATEIASLSRLATELAVARSEFAQPSMLALAALSALTLLGFAPKVSATISPVPLAHGVWLAAVPAAATLLACWIIADDRLGYGAVMAAACTAAGCGLLAREDRHLAQDTEADGEGTLARIGTTATICAFILLSLAVTSRGDFTMMTIAAPAVGLGAFVIGARLFNPAAATTTTQRPGALTRIANTVALPGVVGICLCRTPFLATNWLLAAATFTIIASDGRWLGAFLGSALSTDRAPSKSMRLAAAAEGSAPIQAAFVGLGYAATLLDGPMSIALLISAWMLAFSAPLRARMARAKWHTSEK